MSISSISIIIDIIIIIIICSSSSSSSSSSSITKDMHKEIRTRQLQKPEDYPQRSAQRPDNRYIM